MAASLFVTLTMPTVHAATDCDDPEEYISHIERARGGALEWACFPDAEACSKGRMWG